MTDHDRTQPVQPDPYYAPTPPPAAPLPVPPPAPRSGAGIGRLLVAATLGGVIGASAVGGAIYVAAPLVWKAPPAATAPAKVTTTPAVAVSAAQGEPVEAAAALILPSVVNITVEKTTESPFGARTSSGNGSGVILTADGYVLTNNHVVEGADTILVRIGTEDVSAKVVGTDPTSDIAVVKIARTGLPAARIGRSAELTVGQTVVAVGSPFGLDKTVTSGIVSALHRSNIGGSSSEAAYTNLIQTDASINPGNSGGALVDLQGRVIGLNTLIQSTSGASAGIGFAIPIDYAKSIADQIIAGKKVEHPFLGVATINVDAAFAQQYKLTVNSGALVQQVVDGSPAAAAGIRQGDVIVRIGDQNVGSFEDMLAAIRGAGIGAKVPVEVVRDGKRVTVDVTLGSDTGAR
ncbi:MAG: trypsin-like peptidase domain-containing protein [Coriobacteriia bacterium]|nr:trypsin-like peptidase domain-containing protein [Coriobacteriia bacterium]